MSNNPKLNYKCAVNNLLNCFDQWKGYRVSKYENKRQSESEVKVYLFDRIIKSITFTFKFRCLLCVIDHTIYLHTY